MKKTYIAPDVLIVDIETQYVMAQSELSVLSAGCGDDALEGGSRSTLWGED